MTIKYEKDEVSFSVSWLLEQMTTEQKKDIIERLSCENDIIEHVVSQITTGYTENCSSGSRSCGLEIEPHTPLDKARRALAMSADAVARKELEDALRSLKTQQAWHDHYRDWAFQMYHAWGKQSQCPHKNTPSVSDSSKYIVIKKSE